MCSRGDDDEPERVPSKEGDHLVISRRTVAKRLDFTGDIEAYTHCEDCDPIIFERENDHWDRVDHRHVRCSWKLPFDHGTLTRVEPVRLETRDTLREQMVRDGLAVLPDDDRIAKKHLKMLREGRRRLF
jgi:hypothetical protein